jgi:hypothetical protein
MGVLHPGYIISMESSNVKEKAVLALSFGVQTRRVQFKKENKSTM